MSEEQLKGQLYEEGADAKFVQIAVSATEGMESLYALDANGMVWMYATHLKSPYWFRLRMMRVVEVEDDE